MLVPNGTRKVILNVCCNSRHSWEMIGSDRIGPDRRGVYVARPPRRLAPCDRVDRAPKLAANRSWMFWFFFFFPAARLRPLHLLLLFLILIFLSADEPLSLPARTPR